MRKESWKIVKFKDVVDLKQGLAFNSKNNHLMTEEGIPLLRIVDLNNNSETKFVNPDLVSKNFISKTNDIIYSRTGAQLGLVYTNRVGIVHNNCFRIIPHKGIHNMYLYWYLKQPAIIDHARNIAGGAAQPDLNHTAFKSISFTYPENIKTQQKIASILSSYDELIENNIQRIKLLEEMAEEIYKEWFVRLRFPGYENTKIVDGLPEGWEHTKVENVLKTSSGGTPSRLKEAEYYGGSIDWIKTGELKDTFILNAQETITEIGLKNSSAKLFPSNTLLMAMYGVNIGQLGISVKKSAANQAVCVFNPISGIQFSIYYTFFFFKSMRLHLFNISMGAAQQNLSQDLIKKINILKPKAEIITRYDLIVEPMFEEIKVLTQKNQLLQETRDLLLPRLISGKLSVAHLIDKEEALGMVAEPRAEYQKQK